MGRRGGASESAADWATSSDQLIGALNVLDPEAIHRSGLEATHRDDLLDIAALLSRLPLMAIMETDDSDLIGGALPTPFRDGEWVSVRAPSESDVPREQVVDPLVDYGTLPRPDALARAAEACAGADRLAGAVGIWVYTTQRVLSLAWAARAEELRDGLQELAHLLQGELSVACMWADARGLADDGLGWTRIVPSTTRLLVVVTQVDLPGVCRIYDRVVGSHLACGVPVITFSPEARRATVHVPSGEGDPRAQGQAAEVLATARIRRSNAYPRQMMTGPGLGPEDVEVLAALRLDPSQGPAVPGRVSDVVAEAGYGVAGAEIGASDLLGHSERRVRMETLARSTAATWDDWFMPRLHQSPWAVGMAPLQLDVIEQLVTRALAISDNPFKRRKLLDVLLEDPAGYALPPSIVEDAEQLIAMILDAEEG